MADEISSNTPGQMLRTAREARGEDLATAHEGTKIPQPLLEALERDEYHKLSGPLYVRSFLRNYGEWLGLDVDTLLRGYEALSGVGMAGGGEDMVWSEETVEVKRVGGGGMRQVLILTVGGVLAAAVVALAIWWLVSRGGREEPAPEPVSRAEAAVEAPADPAPPPLDETPAERLARLNADSLVVAGEDPAATDQPPPRPTALPADAQVPFADGVTVDLVLRVLVPAPTNCSVRWDGQPAAKPVVWPTQARPLPDAGIEPGVAYAVDGGFAVYWGAGDNFTLTLGALDGASAQLNGRDLPVGQWKPGQPVVLDQHTLDRMGG